MTDYFQYWKPSTVAMFKDDEMVHIAGGKLAKVVPGDVVWVVTIVKNRLRLFLRFPVARCLSEEQAEELLGDVWAAKYHFLSADPEGSPTADVDLTGLASKLRFLGSADRLKPGFTGQHLQSVRRLTPQSAALLEDIWSKKFGKAAASKAGAMDSDDEFPEGATVRKMHEERERNAALVKAKRAAVLAAQGKLVCDVCAFDFAKTYGKVGDGFIECHHTVPVSELKPGHKTKLEDVVLLCSNCHRMVHRKRPWLSVSSLNNLLAS